MKKLVILVLVLVVAAVFWSKKSEKSQEKNLEVNSDTEETDSGDTKLDEHLCSMARKDNTRAAWDFYLEEFPKGKCAKEGRTVRDKYKRIGNLEWSNVVELASCEELAEDGHTDWRKPNIDELRTLIQNHPGTVSGGKCRISEEHNKLGDAAEDCGGEEGNNFSKFGDDKKLWSLSRYVVVSEEPEQGAWVVNFENGGVESVSDSFNPAWWGEYRSTRCVRQDEKDSCNTAKKYNKFYYWQHYFENFPNGKCIGEAKAFIEKEDKKVCKEARKENTRAVWEKYLKKFPKGECAKEGNAVRNKFKKVGGFEWSDMSDEPMSADEAIGNDDDSYCHSLREEGYSDWRLPTIDEIRVLVQNHPGTVVGGTCKIYAQDSLEFDKYGAFNLKNCDGIEGDSFSKLGDKETLWSSSVYDTTHGVFCVSVNYRDGGVLAGDFYYDRLYVRCVRQDEPDACKTAKKYNKPYYWKHYLENFPNGKCATEAKKKIGAKKEPEKAADKKGGKQPAANPADKKAMAGKKWSSRSSKAMNWKQANKYCENLKEDGSSNWRLPTISELRTLITECDSTEAGGTCGVTDQCLSVEECKNKACSGCGRKAQHNRFGDKGFFWSSSISSDNNNNAWYR